MNPAINKSAAPRPLDADADRLISAIFKTRGLLYALAYIAARPPEDGINSEPLKEEAEGLSWLAMDLGQELENASREYIHAHPAREGGEA